MAEEFAHGGLVRPEVTVAQASVVADEIWGLGGDIRELDSNQDRNFLISAPTGRYVLKFANAVTDRAELEAQNAALHRVATAGLRVPLPVPSRSGAELENVGTGTGTGTGTGAGQLLARVLDYVEGEPLFDIADFGPEQARLIGTTAGRIARALADFDHPGTRRTIQWDLRAATLVVDSLLEWVPIPGRRDAVAIAREEAAARLARVADRLPTQTIHADVTDDNLVVDARLGVGVIDFGDLQRSWRVAELATACAAILAHASTDPRELLLETVRGFTAHVPLEDAELTALGPLIVLRTAVLVVSGEQQVAIDDGNDYAELRRAVEWRSFQLASGWDPEELEALVRAAAHPGSAALPELGRLLPEGLNPELVDLSPRSAALDAGAWLEDDTEQRLMTAAAQRSGAAVTRWGEHRLTRARVRAPRGTAATLALGSELAVPAGTSLHAPFPGELEADAGGLLLRGKGIALRLTGASAAAAGGAAAHPIAPGEVFATAGTATAGAAAKPGALAVIGAQLIAAPGAHPPFFAAPHTERSWRELCPDPSRLFGVDVAAPLPDAAAVVRRRESAYATVQEHYYRRPPQIERGWREFLIDETAQVYVDAVNNVAATGHGHPALTAAATRQWALLNTNSRFNYALVAEFADRLARLAPEGLDTVFLVNSGSEAVDLALRLAMAATDRSRVLAAREAYHGWTVGADAVTTSLGDNPRALSTRPAWVELIDAPNPVRGTHRGPDSASDYLADLDTQLAALGEAGRAELAGIIIEPVFGNGGGVLLPDGYLAGVFERVRAFGGVCIADEVQVGYGRLGHHFWGFEQQGAVPDVITIAKAMGNGQPLGAVITTRAIADAFAAEGSFFSSAGGSPVSCAIGLAVLDVMRDERLQDNARTVGDRFRAGLEELAARHPSIGAVHGLGLYLGVELVTDRASFAPATELADAVCEALLDEGCIVQPTGDHKNVLKIKPPLCITAESTDYVVERLDRVLTSLRR